MPNVVARLSNDVFCSSVNSFTLIDISISLKSDSSSDLSDSSDRTELPSYLYPIEAFFFALRKMRLSKQERVTTVKECDRFSRKISHFQGVSSPFEKAFQIPALFKKLKDLLEP